jgi:hypothetical protein
VTESATQSTKRPVWPWFAGGGAIVVAVIAAILVVFLNIDGGVKPASSSRSAATSTQAAIGAQVRDGSLTYVVTGIETATFLADPRYPGSLNKQARGEFLIVDLTVTNVGNAELTYYSTFNRLAASGSSYDNDEEAWVYAGNLITDLAPGDSLDTAAVFDVPVGTVPDSIELHDAMGSKGAVVKL